MPTDKPAGPVLQEGAREVLPAVLPLQRPLLQKPKKGQQVCDLCGAAVGERFRMEDHQAGNRCRILRAARDANARELCEVPTQKGLDITAVLDVSPEYLPVGTRGAKLANAPFFPRWVLVVYEAVRVFRTRVGRVQDSEAREIGEALGRSFVRRAAEDPNLPGYVLTVYDLASGAERAKSATVAQLLADSAPTGTYGPASFKDSP